MDIPYQTFIKEPLSPKRINHKENKSQLISLSYSLELISFGPGVKSRGLENHEAYYMI
jgi:hypothetical protein